MKFTVRKMPGPKAAEGRKGLLGLHRQVIQEYVSLALLVEYSHELFHIPFSHVSLALVGNHKADKSNTLVFTISVLLSGSI